MTGPRRRSKLLRMLAALCVASSVVVGAGSLPAGGQTDGASLFPVSYLVQYGWWNKAQQTPDGGTGVPKPPNAPDDGIYIAYEAVSGSAPGAVTGPVTGGGLPESPVTAPGSTPPPEQQVLAATAYGAVRFEAPVGAEGLLTLSLTDGGSSSPGAEAGAIMACLATSPWDPVQNGRFDGAPTYDCTSATSGTVSGDGVVVFEVPGHLLRGRVLDLVLVPVGTQPYTMSIDAPDDSSFVITNAHELSTPTGDDTEFEPFEPPVTDSGGTFIPSSEPYTFEPPPVVEAPEPTVALTEPTRRREVAQPLRNPLAKDATRAERIAAVALLLLLATGLWWFGGQEARPPRLLGSLGARQAALVPAGQAPRSAPTRGIGRFARPRLGTAPRL